MYNVSEVEEVMESKHPNELTAFVVAHKIFRVIGTNHAIQRLRQRKVDEYHIASALLAMGMKLLEYNNSGKQIMLRDMGRGLSTVIAIENYTIVLITVLEKVDVYVKDNTVIEDFKIVV
jgi:hypothetical protein